MHIINNLRKIKLKNNRNIMLKNRETEFSDYLELEYFICSDCIKVSSDINSLFNITNASLHELLCEDHYYFRFNLNMGKPDSLILIVLLNDFDLEVVPLDNQIYIRAGTGDEFVKVVGTVNRVIELLDLE